MSEPEETDDVGQAATGLQRAQADQVRAYEILEQAPPPWYRFRAARVFRRAEVNVRHAHAKIRQHGTTLAHIGGGADPDEWGVFSVAPGMSLEHTLERLAADRSERPELADAAAAARVKLAPARAAAALGDALARVDIEQVVSALASQVPVMIARDLIVHLPTRARPLPRQIAELNHHGSYTLSVGESPSEIRLHDIAVGPARGSGFGTSLLQELCRYADRRSVPIVCTMVTDLPMMSTTASTADFRAQRASDERRLARWFQRHGFKGNSSTSEWGSFTPLCRDPQTV